MGDDQGYFPDNLSRRRVRSRVESLRLFLQAEMKRVRRNRIIALAIFFVIVSTTVAWWKLQ